MKEDDLFVFAAEEPLMQLAIQDEADSWKVLIVDDFQQVHEVIELALSNLILFGKKISLYHAYSAFEAKNILFKNKEIDLVFLDIIMESNDAGFQLVDYVRNELNNKIIRILIITGQPDVHKNQNIIVDYDINDYKLKTELTSASLKIATTTAFRTLNSIKELHVLQSNLFAQTKSILRFVPLPFLNLLRKSNITEVDAGNFIETELTIVFLDIRSFTRLSEFSYPIETFQLINSLMAHLIPVVNKNKGFIDKFIGDALMAIFENANDAIKACIQLLEAMKKFNSRRLMDNKLPIKIGIGVNTGSVILGVVGFEERLECTVVSDVVNVASRMEQFTKLMGCDLLITENTINALNTPPEFNYRFLGNHQLKGKKIIVGVYEIFDADTPDIIELKRKTKDLFDTAMQYFREKNNQEGKNILRKILEINPRDEVVKMFLEK